MEKRKLVPYSVYLAEDQVKQLKAFAEKRQASKVIRDAITMILDGSDAYNSGYNQAIRDVSKIIYECPEAQMVAVRGKDLGALLTEQVEMLYKKEK